MLLTSKSSSSLNASVSEASVSTQLCFLPMQTHIYIWYILQFIVTIILLAAWPTKGFGWWEPLVGFFGAIRSNFASTTKEKDEEDCDYEMVWDAEGSMHLVKKATSKVPATKLDVGLGGRGNIVARPSAKKHNVQEGEASVLVELGADIKADNNGNLSRLSKSKARRLIQRFIRVFRLLIVIAAVNVPLYMMLLFKDWIEL